MVIAWTILAALGLLSWLYLLFFRHGFWRAGPRLGKSRGMAIARPGVVAVIPARDEAAVIEQAVQSLLAQDYPGQLDLIVVDDDSSDGTADVVERFRYRTDGSIPARRAGSRRRSVRVVRNSAPPAGWSGKLWAIRTGIEHVEASGLAAPFLLLTDADIAHDPATLSALIEKMVNEDLDLTSLMVRLHVSSFWERLLIPPFVFFFQMLYPFPAVNDPRHPEAAAAGGCMLLRRDALDDAGGIGAIRGALIDDVALGRLIKRRPQGNGRIWLGLTVRTVSLRAYESLAPIWSMVARTADTQLDHSLWKLVGAVFGLLVVYLLPPILVLGWPFHQDPLLGGLGLTTWLAMSVAFRPISALYGQSVFSVSTLPLAALFYLAMTIDSAHRYRRGRGGMWKGRVFVEQGRRADAGDRKGSCGK